MTGRLVVFNPSTGVSRVIASHQAALQAFLASSNGATLVIGRLSAVPEQETEEP